MLQVCARQSRVNNGIYLFIYAVVLDRYIGLYDHQITEAVETLKTKVGY